MHYKVITPKNLVTLHQKIGNMSQNLPVIPAPGATLISVSVQFQYVLLKPVLLRIGDHLLDGGP